MFALLGMFYFLIPCLFAYSRGATRGEFNSPSKSAPRFPTCLSDLGFDDSRPTIERLTTNWFVLSWLTLEPKLLGSSTAGLLTLNFYTALASFNHSISILLLNFPIRRKNGVSFAQPNRLFSTWA